MAKDVMKEGLKKEINQYVHCPVKFISIPKINNLLKEEKDLIVYLRGESMLNYRDREPRNTRLAFNLLKGSCRQPVNHKWLLTRASTKKDSCRQRTVLKYEVRHDSDRGVGSCLSADLYHRHVQGSICHSKRQSKVLQCQC